MPGDDNETWLLDAGDTVIKKMASGDPSLSPLERLTYCLWAADYGMRNAGDLTTARDLHASFLEDGKAAALELGLRHALTAFSMPCDELEQRYFDLFDAVVSELRAALRD